MACFIWGSIHIVDSDEVRETVGTKFFGPDMFDVNKLSCGASIYQCIHHHWEVAIDCMDVQGNVGGPLECCGA